LASESGIGQQSRGSVRGLAPKEGKNKTLVMYREQVMVTMHLRRSFIKAASEVEVEVDAQR
jgi:hypothetical protein